MTDGAPRGATSTAGTRARRRATTRRVVRPADTARPRRRRSGSQVSGARVPGTSWVIPQPVARWLKPITTAVVTVVAIGLLAAYVFPTRTWLDQRQALAEVGVALDELAAEKEVLSARLDQLDTDDEIESIARSQFGLVLPGEEAYSVLPPPENAINLPEIWPYGPINPREAVAKAVPVNPAG